MIFFCGGTISYFINKIFVSAILSVKIKIIVVNFLQFKKRERGFFEKSSESTLSHLLREIGNYPGPRIMKDLRISPKINY